jgi:hypothetical protein
LTDSYLQSRGAEWKRRAPFRLFYYREQAPTKERPALIFLSQVLPDAYNTGYQEQRYLVTSVSLEEWICEQDATTASARLQPKKGTNEPTEPWA